MITRNKKPIKNKVNLFLDSGAFSAFTQGVEIDIYEYCSFIKKNKKYIETYAVLDVIGSAEKTWENQRIMEKAGLSPLPCFHFGEDIKWLKKYVKKYDYMALGGMVPISSKDLKVWLDDLYSNHLCDKDGMPKIKVHGFGMTSLSLMLRFPWYCMTEEDHEVLTKTGWKFRNELSINEEILCFDKGDSVWQPILEIPTFPVKNADIRKMQNRNFSAKVTANHNWIVTNQNKKNKNWKFRKTDTCKIGDCIPRVGDYQFPIKKKYTDEQVAFLAWFWTDGTIKKRPKYKKDSIVLYQSKTANPEKCLIIEKLLNKTNEPSYWGKNQYELYGSIRDFLLDIAPKKEIPINFIFNLTEKQTEIFIKYSVLADGTKTQLIRKEGFAMAVYREYKKQNMELIRIACLLLGIPTSIYKTKTGGKGLNSSSVNWIYTKEVKIDNEKYTGKLWCVKVPSKAFFTRCNDKIYVTGNSVDSTSWVVTGRMGGILIPKKTGGKYDYTKNPHKITISSKSPTTKKEGAHFQTCTKGQQKIFREYFEGRGFRLGKSSFRSENQKTYEPATGEKWNKKKEGIIETIKSPGLCNDYKLRDELNIQYFLDLEKNMKPWPWKFKIKNRMKSFFE